MYHFDGHRDCQFSCSPQESAKKHKNICPLCKKPLTLGVLNQVERLADRAEQKIDTSFHIPYKNIVPLPEIIADYYGVNRNSKKVEKLYLEIIAKAGNEFVVTLDLNEEELKKIMPTSLTAGIMKMRVREMQVLPGFDGQYGQVKIFSELDRQKSKIIAPQETLF
jgi:PHP family Zn ribbon phosphoesterase